jgi:hypothetical protein
MILIPHVCPIGQRHRLSKISVPIHFRNAHLLARQIDASLPGGPRPEKFFGNLRALLEPGGTLAAAPLIVFRQALKILLAQTPQKGQPCCNLRFGNV